MRRALRAALVLGVVVVPSAALATTYESCNWIYQHFTVQCGLDGMGYNTTVTLGWHVCDGQIVGTFTNGGCQ